MARATEQLPLPAVSDEVRAFCEKEGVGDLLAPLLELTRGLFPAAPMEVRVEHDPEIEGYAKAVIALDTRGWDDETFRTARKEWFEAAEPLASTGRLLHFVLALR